MKIVIVADTYPPDTNGAAYFAERLARELQHRGHTILVLAPSRSLRSGYVSHKNVRVFGIRSFLFFPPVDFRKPLPFIRGTVGKILKEFAPDVVHIQSHFMLGKSAFKAAKRLGIPVVGTNHFMPENLVHFLHLPKPIETKVKQFAWNQFCKTYYDLRAVTAPTDTAADLMRQIGFERPISVISNGINMKIFHPKNDGAYLRTRYNLPDKPLLLYVGRLDKEKMVDTVISAIAKLPKVNLHFVIAGHGAAGASWKKLARELGVADRITFTGFVPDEDLANLYAIADASIMPGIAELQGIATMEAMATGLPVIAANAVATPELVIHGTNGFLFDHNDPQQLADAIRTLFNDHALRKKMGAASLSMIKKHDLDTVMGQFEAIYKNAKASSGNAKS